MSSTATDVKTLLNTYDFYIFPVVNPDGATESALSRVSVLTTYSQALPSHKRQLVCGERTDLAHRAVAAVTALT